MRAAYITRTGPPEVITVGDLPAPAPSPDDSLVRVHAADMNPIDVYWRSGSVTVPLPNPFILGRSLAGVVEAPAAAGSRFRKGDRVWATNQGFGGRQGTWAELAAVPDAGLQPIPPDVSDEDIAAVALVGVTAQLGLHQYAQLRPGETILVTGGAGGVGSCVVQIAKSRGAKVIGLAGTPAKVAACRGLGADLALDYTRDDIAGAVKAFAPNGVNVWWETAREPDFDKVVAMLAPRGRMILMAGREARPAFPVGPFYVKGLSLHGFALFNATPEECCHAGQAINELLASGKLKARIDRLLPLDQAIEAHRLQEASTVGKTGVVSGKIVIKI